MLDIKHPATWVRINWHFYKKAFKKGASAVADIVRKTDNMSKAAIGLVEFSGFKLKMKLIKQLVKMKTTKLGTRPVY